MALRIYDDSTCTGCGQIMALALDPVLAGYWTTMEPVRDYACTALADAQKRDEGSAHSHALRHVVGLREGWEQAREEASRNP